ncbi:MAG: hypothetical protein HN341_19520, partial [Verrucomicrobia bacterium]|nr:hypothetical protein [Verrucomicrobiota bacterium]
MTIYEQNRYLALMGQSPRPIPHWEHWSCPDGESCLTGIDYYDHPRQCRLRMQELYPQLQLPIPDSDDPVPRPEEQEDLGKGRWGTENRDHWQQQDASHRSKSEEDMLAFSPLAQADFSGWQVVV